MNELAVSSLCKSFGAVRAVDGVTFSVAAGEFLALIGPNGAGKSTCFNTINGQLKPDSGAIRFEGRDIAGLPPREICRSGIARTFQVAATFGSMTVAENVQMALIAHAGETYGLWRKANSYHRARAMQLLQQVGMAEAAGRPCRELAYGDVKRVEFAIALASDPRLLLMDEPTAGMAPRERNELIGLVKSIVVERGRFGALYRALNGRSLCLCRSHRCHGARAVDRRRRCQDDPQRPDRPRGLLRQRAHSGARAYAVMSEPPALAVDRLNAWYGTAHILFDMSFTVGRGEVVALMGRNGVGKSTTMKAVMGLLPRRSGTVRLNGRDVSSLKPFEIARLGMGFTPEDRRIFSDLTVLENLDVGVQPPRDLAAGAPANWTVDAVFELFPNLAELRHRHGGHMSGGEQQMLTIARTLMGNPLVILLDEPSEGIAPVIVERIADTIVQLKRSGLSILLSEQNVGFAEAVSDRAYMLEKGQIRWAGTMAELAANAEVQRDYLVL